MAWTKITRQQYCREGLRYGHQKVLVRGHVHEVVIACGADVIARHPCSYEREDFVFNPLHYLALIEQKINALDQAAPRAAVEAIGHRGLSNCVILLTSKPDWTMLIARRAPELPALNQRRDP